MYVSSDQPSHRFLLHYQQPSYSAAPSIFFSIYAAFDRSQQHRKYLRRAMDPLSIAASVSGFLGLAGKIAVNAQKLRRWS
ncbi:hypothetical protein BZA77DRAFT_330578 [Pyronema omphalodes]|nr:hypothetical protein BZA77DRAFT_330578 [Pyronema omphalodes]